MTLYRPLNAFGNLLLKHCERQRRTIHDVARAAGFKGTSRVYYAISIRGSTTAKGAQKRSTPLSEAELVRIARALTLTPEWEEELILTAQIEVAPPRLRKYIRHLEAGSSATPKYMI